MDAAGALLDSSLSHMVSVWALQKTAGDSRENVGLPMEAGRELAKKKHLKETRLGRTGASFSLRWPLM